MTSIGKRAFYRANMPSITIPKSVVELGDYFVGSDTITNGFNYTGIIIGYRGSAAERYATERNILFTAID